MFCPSCRTEYLEGITQCPDCKVGLVAQLPEILPPEYVDYQEILTTFNPVDIAMIKSLLGGEDIDFYFHGENFNYVEPMVQPARLMVRTDQVDDVKEILKDLRIKYMISFKDESSADKK